MKFKYLYTALSIVMILFCSTGALASPYPICDIQPQPPVLPENVSYTRYVSLDKDFIVRFAGNFSSMYYYPDKTKSSQASKIDIPYQYLGGNGALMMMMCGSHFCAGIELSVGGILPYSGASPRPSLATYAHSGVRTLVFQRTIMTFTLAAGIMYSMKYDDEKLFINSQYGMALKFDWDWTLYIIPDFGIGVHASPSLIMPDEPVSYILNLEAGLHFTFKY